MTDRTKLLLTALFLLTALCFACSDAMAVPNEKNNFELYFGPSQDKTKTIDNYFIQLVDSAKKTIDGAFYELRLQSIADAFIRAHKRGVKIRLVTDTDNYDNEFMKQVRKAGIDVKQENRSAIMHNKFAIVDSVRIWTGSYNLTDTCSYNNNNNALSFYSKELCDVYQLQFDKMFEKGLFGPDTPSDVDKQVVEIPILGQKSKVEVYFAPQDDPNAHIIELLKGAKKGIFFMHFAFTANEVSDTLIEKAKGGINVAGIFDSKLYRSTGPYSEFFKLTSADIKIILADNPSGKFHHKVFIVDPGTEDGFIVTGSENSSSNGDKANNENVLVVHNPKVAAAFYEEFKKLFGGFSNSYATCVNFYVKPEQEVASINMVFNSNGKPIDKIEVGYPARWALNGKEKVSIFTIDQKPYPKGTLIFNKKGFTAVNLGLKAFGKGSFLIFNFQNLKAPKIKGGYNLYLKSATQNSGKPLPLNSQPGIQVSDSISNDEDITNFDSLLQKMYMSYSELMNIQQNTANDEVFDKLFDSWTDNYKEVTELILTDVKAGSYEKLDKFLALYSKLDADHRSKVSGFVKELKDLLKKNSVSGDAEAKNRLKMID